ncbi:SseB family protein [Streptomyces sp. PTD5-9]|uniref:SseB family protein n=1 Tax=Streptomyces sp. PTD5-9 TaxID=3120150 RepID=UPI003008468E
MALQLKTSHVMIPRMTRGGDMSKQQHPMRLADLAGPTPSYTASTQPSAPATDPGLALSPSRANRAFAVLLGEFRRTAVLVPFDESGGLWSAELGGVRWICAFSDEESLARFARARGDSGREWAYRSILGARLLDAVVPSVAGPAGVALDAGSPDGMVFPPVAGVVPETVAVDAGRTAWAGRTA